MVAMGEDRGRRPDGFDLSNSPVAVASADLVGLSLVRAASDALAQSRPDARSFALSRSGFADPALRRRVDRRQLGVVGTPSTIVAMLCNLDLSGVPFVGADIGGFWGDATPELFARWIQAGVLYPFMRGHSHKENRPNEPWEFGEEVEAVAREALRLRYALRPYLYTMFHEAATTGAPVLRPLLWSFSADPRAAAIEDEVMLGDAVLAAPVLHEGQRQRDVYLPAGGWYTWWTGEAHEGPADVPVAAPLDRLPLCGRAGTIVPLATVNDDGTIDDSVVTRRVFPGDGDGAMYDDDGETLAYRHGASALRRSSLRTDGTTLTVNLRATAGDFPCSRRLVFVTPQGHSTELTDTGEAVQVSLPAGRTIDKQRSTLGARAWPVAVGWPSPECMPEAQVDLTCRSSGRRACERSTHR